jgi:NitT/TauT family transport system substrate-binding protein
MVNSTGSISRRNFGRSIAAIGAAATIGGFHIGTARAQDRRKVVFLFDVSPYGKHALFYPAVENGYFKDAGLDVQFESGKGSSDVALKVAAGAADFGFADAPTTMLARATGAKLKEVMMVHYKAMNNVLTLPTKAVRKPKDMEGFKLGATAGDAPRIALPALAKINGFDASKVEIITIESSAKPAMLMSRQVDGVLSLAAYTPVMAIAAKRMGQEIVEMLYSDYGLDIYSNGIIARDDSLAKDPDMVRGFVQAIIRSCIFAVEKPAEAHAMFMKHNQAANPDIARAQLDVAIKHLLVDEVVHSGVGPMSEKKMAFTLDIVREYFGPKGPVALPDTYTNAFVKAGQKAVRT